MRSCNRMSKGRKRKHASLRIAPRPNALSEKELTTSSVSEQRGGLLTGRSLTRHLYRQLGSTSMPGNNPSPSARICSTSEVAPPLTSVWRKVSDVGLKKVLEKKWEVENLSCVLERCSSDFPTEILFIFLEFKGQDGRDDYTKNEWLFGFEKQRLTYRTSAMYRSIVENSWLVTHRGNQRIQHGDIKHTASCEGLRHENLVRYWVVVLIQKLRIRFVSWRGRFHLVQLLLVNWQQQLAS